MRNLTINCDICQKVCEFGKDLSTFQFTQFALTPDKQLIPMPRQEDYCSQCTDEIKKVVTNIKNGQKTS